jgi:hypothetical protein
VRHLQKLQPDAPAERRDVGGYSGLHRGLACHDVLERAQRLQTVLAAHQDATELPNTPEEASGFTPHEWVLEAMRRAYSMGRVAGRSAAKEEIRDALGVR